MPSKSSKQKRLMRACLDPKFRKKAKCPPKSVAREFVMADKRKKKRK